MVFECKNKYDYINYAVKRITLPSTDENGNKVKGPVKLHAILDHRNVVKYYSTWEERPPGSRTWSSAPSAPPQRSSP